jgi:putative molybdopterin biosynthesis protein
MIERKVFRTLLNLEDARNRIWVHVPPCPAGYEDVSLQTALGRIVSEDVRAPIDVPGFDRASMDGYAVRARDTFGADDRNPVKLRIIGAVETGEDPQVLVEASEAAEISTGAPIPRGADAVVMVEYTQHSDDQLRIFRAVNPGENIMAAGSDLMAGEHTLRKGQTLTPKEMGLLSAIGLATAKVYRKPRVAVISSGNELISPGGHLTYGKIYDINSTIIAAAVTESGGEVVLQLVARDTEEDLKLKIEEGLECADLLLTSGSTSAGVGDRLYRILDSYGEPGVVVHGLAVKPGKPTIFAVVDGKPVFGLPGYPTSALTIYTLLVHPVISAMAGVEKGERGTIDARCASKIYSAKGRREFLPVHLIKDETGSLLAYPTTEGSGAITSLSMADGFIEIPESVQFLEEDESVNVQLYSPRLIPSDLVIIGSHCIGLDILLEQMRRSSPSLRAKTINVGSTGGFNSIKRGEADVAGIHLLDENSGEYNLPFLDRYGLQEKAVVVRGYLRQQGLIVGKGNPRGITGVEDLLKGNVSFMNRNRGSGTRVLFDLCLKRIADRRKSTVEQLSSQISGYETETKSHSAVAAAVLHRRVDVGLGIKTAAEMYGLDFVPVAEEYYDFLILRKRLQKEVVKSLLDTLRSNEFKSELSEKAPGLVPTDKTGIILN